MSCTITVYEEDFPNVAIAVTGGELGLGVTIDGTGSYSNSGQNGLLFQTYGVVPTDDTPYGPQSQGGPLSVTNQADMTLTGIFGSYLVYEGSGQPALGGAVIVADSFGAEGFADSEKNPNEDNFDGSPGGTVTLVNDGTLSVAGNGGFFPPGEGQTALLPDPTLTALGAYSFGGDGVAIKAHDTDWAGAGGDGGTVSVTNNGAITISNVGPLATYGIYALSRGGVGSNRKNYADADGGSGGTVTVTHNGSISSTAPLTVGILAASVGGDSDFDDKNDGGDASGAGDGGSVSVEIADGASVTTGGGVGIGVMALSAGGSADNGWEGTGGTVTVTVDGGGTVDTTASNQSLSVGVLAVSAGNLGDVLPFATSEVNSSYPGHPGDVTVTNDGTIRTAGSLAVGVAALSVGGATIVTNAEASGSSVLGNTGSVGGFDGQSATVTNNGAITTNGAGAFGIVAISAGNGGGLLNLEGSDQALTVGGGTNATEGGNAAAVNVTNGGSVTTGDGSGGGKVAIGIVAQSIGGGGGSSNAPSFFVGGHDADGSGGGNGGEVTVTTTAASTITTSDDGALGILAQSIGGGGGNGANASGIFVATGGVGGNGGDGGSVDVELTNAAGGGITTSGHYAGAVLAQSIGGGGGNGGYADTVDELISVSIGGRGGSGGDGGSVTARNVLTITTSGNQSYGLLTQSIGGGGGAGGAAHAFDAGILTIAVAVGGAGGSGGAAGVVNVTNDFHIYTGCDAGLSGCGFANSGTGAPDGADSVGILAQSIGGGGGKGGSAVAKSLSLPSDEVPLTLAMDFAVGGSGGTAGDGNSVTVANAGEVVTAGDGSYGVLAQSIGGGGGDGGDSTAAAYAIEGSMPSLKVALAIGGSGGAAGTGDSVTVTNGQSATCGGCDGQIYTYGQHATGILAQSIGGGGGTGGSGNASASSPNLGDDTGKSIDLTFGVGGSGGVGGTAGAVSVTNDQGSSIVTVGPAAQGVLAQSIGGGGGAAGGGQAGASGDTFQLNLTVGGTGGAGNTGGSVSVTNAGTISTGGLFTNAAGLSIVTGGDGVGILAQSIGGGGGTGGTSDPAATVDAAGQVEDALNAPSNSYSVNLGVGGNGGAGADGDTVTVTNSGGITTKGVRAYGVQAQSIGGGGGSAGAATSSSNSVLGGPVTSGTETKAGTYAADLAIGGKGGAAGDGGDVSVGNSGTVMTAGYGAHAVLAHSVGGGGGVGAEGTVDNTTTIGLGAGVAGSGGAGGDGHTVEVDQSGTLQTAGDDAFGILAQSIGGGGGTAGVGCSNSAQVGPLNNSASLCLGNSGVGATVSDSVWNDSSDYTVNLGGQPGAYGNGGSVTIDHTSGAIVTTGARAFGIAAQSIGGGGGLVAAANVNLGNVTLYNYGPGNGGSVDITLGASGADPTAGSITTYGDGAWGIFAQSLGYGGGFAGDASQQLVVQEANYMSAASASTDTTNGGAITVDLYGNVMTSGANAHGLFLQSAGGGGAVLGYDGQLLVGSIQSSGAIGPYNGGGGAISVTQYAGTIATTGAGSVAILAQSTGNDPGSQNPVAVTIAGTVTGGSGGNAAGIWVSGGVSSASPVYDGGTFNSITIQSGGTVGTVDGIAGMAIKATDSVTNIVNDGTIVGSIDLGTGNIDGNDPGSIQNNGTFAMGATVAALNFTSGGTVNPGGAGAIATTAYSHVGNSGIPSNFHQTGGGVLSVDVDSLAAGQTADLLAVSGDATVEGTIAPTASNLLPGRYVVLTASGSLTSTAVAQQGLLFGWNVDNGTAGEVAIIPQADLTPTGSDLSTNEQAVATYLQSIWNGGGSDGLAPLFGRLSRLQAGGDYKDSLDDISPEKIPAHASDQAVATRTSLSSAMSCPGFEADGVLLGETSCVWTRVGGSHTSRYEDGDTPGYDLDGAVIRFGGQKEVRDDWFLGGSAAYSRTWAKADQGGSRSDGEGVDASLALKHTHGPWYFAAGLGGGYSWYDNTRKTSIGGVPESFDSNSKIYTLGGRLRVAYEVPFDGWYLRPYADLDAIYTHAPGYHEDSGSPLALDVKSQSKTTGAFSPMLEAGGRLDLSDGWLLRFYAAGGGVFLSDDSWTTRARLQGAPQGSGTFSTESKLPRQLGTLDLGLQLYQDQGLEVRIEYGLQAGQHYLGQTGSARVGFRF